MDTDLELSAEAIDELVLRARGKLQEALILLDQVIVKATILSRINQTEGDHPHE